jgi:UDP-glucose 4-epimerase
VNEVLKVIGEIAGLNPKVQYAEKQQGDMRHTYASTEKAQSEIGYIPQIRLAEGLRKEFHWLKDLHQKGLVHRVD